MNRIDRLFAILLMLQRSSRVRAIDLAQRFGVSERTIYRDISALSEMGVPVVTLPGEGYTLTDTYRLPPVMLSPEEATALFLAGKMLLCSSDGEINRYTANALDKISAILPPQTQAQVTRMAQIIDFFPAQQPLNWDEPHLMDIITAIEAQHTLHITYRAYQSVEITERDVDPYDLTYSDGAWYVNGYCHLRRDMRGFRLNRITSLTITLTHFERRIIIPPTEQTITVEVRFDAGILPHVHERQHYSFSHETDDGRLIYTVHALDEIRNWIFGFGAQAQVIAPETLREWIIDEAQRLIKRLT